MSRREDFQRVLSHEQPHRLIVDLGGCPQSNMEGDLDIKLMQRLGIPVQNEPRRYEFGETRLLDERLLQAMDSDTRAVGGIIRPKESLYQRISPQEYIDEWGLRYRYNGLYWDAVNTPLKDATLEELKRYPFPDPDSIDIAVLDAYAQRAKRLYEETDYIVCANHPVYGVFELGCWLCGFEDFLCRLLIEPEFVHLFFKRVLEYQLRIIKPYYQALGAYIHYTTSGDDFATQRAPFMSRELFVELVKPYFKERIRVTKQYTKAAFLHHSCGSVYSLIDDLIDCGVDILNPIQPKAQDMEPRRLKKEFGSRIVFHGGVDTQELLPFATARQVRDSVRETIEIMNQAGGYIFAAAHNLQPDVNIDNLLTMFEVANSYKPS